MDSEPSKTDRELTLADVLSHLETISTTPSVDADSPLIEMGVDSVELLEWLFALEEESGISLDDLSAGLPDLDALTPRQLHRHLCELQQ